jgi:predicted nucleotidyltransferase
MKNLFITSVGSHMWSMQTPESDVDLMVVYQEGTRDILEGQRISQTLPDKSFMRDGMLIDQKEQEIGHLVNKIVSGNINAIWTVCTPLVIQDHPYLRELREITKQNLSTSSYASTRGMTISQMKDIEKRKQVMPKYKAARTAIRTCRFGIRLLSLGMLLFESSDLMKTRPTEGDVEQCLLMLEDAYENSGLPDHPDDRPFKEFLFRIRMEELNGW